MKPEQVLVLRAKTAISLADEVASVGADLFKPLQTIDNAALVLKNGRIIEVAPFTSLRLPVKSKIRDLGEVCLAPAWINAHTHLQLSFLAGRLQWEQGFTAWLADMIPKLRLVSSEEISQAVQINCQLLAESGTGYVGDIAGSVENGLRPVVRACRNVNLGITHFCEWFGFKTASDVTKNYWPVRVQQDLQQIAGLDLKCAPSGHALYSTAPEILQKINLWCLQNKRVFCFHLAESPEETEMLTYGSGSLYELYKNCVLPPNWQAPFLRPLAYAENLGLLGKHVLAVHGTQLNEKEAERLAHSGTALCLCPRSNKHLAVGSAPVRTLIAKGVLLCLGTDGLSSNTDLDVFQEALYLQNKWDLPPEALIRMLTVNGTQALHLPFLAGGRLIPGAVARFCIMDNLWISRH